MNEDQLWPPGGTNPQIPPQTAVVACSLSQKDLAVRGERWRALAGRAAGQVSRTATGLYLTFRAEPGVADELAELAALERDCCGFTTWSVASAEDQVALEVSAKDEVAIAAVQAMFDTLPQRN